MNLTTRMNSQFKHQVRDSRSIRFSTVATFTNLRTGRVLIKIQLTNKSRKLEVVLVLILKTIARST